MKRILLTLLIVLSTLTANTNYPIGSAITDKQSTFIKAGIVTGVICKIYWSTSVYYLLFNDNSLVELASNTSTCTGGTLPNTKGKFVAIYRTKGEYLVFIN